MWGFAVNLRCRSHTEPYKCILRAVQFHMIINQKGMRKWSIPERHLFSWAINTCADTTFYSDIFVSRKTQDYSLYLYSMFPIFTCLEVLIWYIQYYVILLKLHIILYQCILPAESSSWNASSLFCCHAFFVGALADWLQAIWRHYFSVTAFLALLDPVHDISSIQFFCNVLLCIFACWFLLVGE